MTDTGTAAIGFAAHSGWAAAVGVSQVDNGFRVLVRDRFEMADPRVSGSKQPYHAVRSLPIGEAAERLAGYSATAELMASEAIQRIVEQLGERGYRVIGGGILESAGRKGKSLEEILRSHPLIHAADGDHFRSAITGAAARRGLALVRVPARELESQAAVATGTSVPALRQLLQTAGRECGPPWRSDQKSAALLAWLVLCKSSGGAAEQGDELGKVRDG